LKPAAHRTMKTPSAHCSLLLLIARYEGSIPFTRSNHA
jgi:hypothetical protein